MSIPADMIPIDATVGNEVTRASSRSFYLFWLPRAEDMGGQIMKKEVGLDTAARYSTRVRKEWAKTENASHTFSHEEGGGQWTTARYNLAEGTALKVWIEKTAWGASSGKAAAILLCSKDAPLSRITLHLSGESTCTRTHVNITGKFWVLNRDTVSDFPSVPELTNQCRHFASPIEIGELLQVEELAPAPEKAMAARVETKAVSTGTPVVKGTLTGNETVILRTRKARRVMG